MLEQNERIEDRVERSVLTGVRNRWWCIGPSAMVGDQPVGIKRLGVALVAWRDTSGKVNLIEDICPHRGAPLSMGRLEDGKLSCRYHGVEVSGEGIVTAVPAYPQCAYVGKKMVRSYPVVEHFQGLWAWFGEDEDTEPLPLVFPREYESADWTGFPISMTWQTNYQYMWDNVLDIMHPEYLHKDTQYFESGVANQVLVTPTDTGFTVRREISKGDNVELMEFIDTGAFWFRIGYNAPPECGPGGNWRIFPLATPIDEHTCQITIWRMRNVAGWEADLFRFMFNTKLEHYNWEIVQEDKDILEGMPPWPMQEKLYQHDVGLARLRRHVRDVVRKQLESRERMRTEADAQESTS
jgi:phenylpropionate dioxygenase-like ring-hydroxylating dioxygenase large terminal subunit